LGDAQRFEDSDEAMRVFGRTEREYQDAENVIVVMFTAPSLEAIRSTHPHYFGRPKRSRSEGDRAADEVFRVASGHAA
jgi:hypothetical protein